MNKQELQEMYEAALQNAGQEYGFSTTNLQVAEKFAELIVEKCINCCDEVNRINKAYIKEYYIDPEYGPKECIEVIKKHFGVK